MFINLRERERNIDQLPPVCTPTGDWTCNPGVCPDWGSSLQPFGAQGDAPPSWATWPGKSFTPEGGSGHPGSTAFHPFAPGCRFLHLSSRSRPPGFQWRKLVGGRLKEQTTAPAGAAGPRTTASKTLALSLCRIQNSALTWEQTQKQE